MIKADIKHSDFLKDVFICSLGAYGGPEAHYGVFIDQLVVKKGYLTEEDMMQLIALTTILPGPSSTQTIVAIGYKIGGGVLAFLTMLVWSLPVILIMSLLSFSSQFLIEKNISKDIFRYIGPMAVGFIVVASYRISKKVVKDKITLFLFLLGAIITYFFRMPFIYPLVLIFGAVVSVINSKEKNIFSKISIKAPWIYFIVFSSLAVGSFLLKFIFDNRLINLFESFFRYGYLVIGGGQVVVPLMYSELVEINAYMNNQEFLTGFGLVQGLPGPMFSFSAYAGGMALRNYGGIIQFIGAVISGYAIFLPGILLIYFVYPIWESIKEIKAIKISLKGITAVAGGLILTSSLVLMQKSGFNLENITVMLITAILLFTKKVSAPIIVAITIFAGFIIK